MNSYNKIDLITDYMSNEMKEIDISYKWYNYLIKDKERS